MYRIRRSQNDEGTSRDLKHGDKLTEAEEQMRRKGKGSVRARWKEVKKVV
jgi:hypothetical protein